MAIDQRILDRLINQLNASKTAQEDKPLWQVIIQLIKKLKELEALIGTVDETITNNTTNQTIHNTIIQSSSSNKGGKGGSTFIGIPGPRGATGATGIQGPAGPPSIGPMGINGKDGRDAPPIPGAKGERGFTGIQGPPGSPTIVLGRQGKKGRDGRLIPLPPLVSSGGSSAWELIEQRTCTGNANEDFLNLGDYNEIRVLIDGITISVSGLRQLQVSTDNGSTFLSAGGDYLSVAATGVETNAGAMAFHNTSTTAGRSGEIIIRGFNLNTLKTALNTNITTLFIIPTTTPYNAVRVNAASGGNLNAGTIYVFGR